ncbi:VgrG protein [Minicystis rosea]|nr:VgrG protein [Minicystis rosea]
MRMHEALGEPLVAELEMVSPEPVDARAVLGKACAVFCATAAGERVFHGIVTRFIAIATAQETDARRYELMVRSAVHVLSLRRRTRVFQHMSVPDVIRKVLGAAGFDADHVASSLLTKHSPREYVVQYAEDDLTFVRRLCEDEGLYFRFEPRDGFDAFVLEDSSVSAPPALSAPLPLVDASHLVPDRAVASDCSARRRRRAGTVTLRDFDPEHPTALLEGTGLDGLGAEKAVEVYEAPGRFKTPGAGARRARLLLEGLRADARAIRFASTALALAPGLSFRMEPSSDYRGAARPNGPHVAVAIDHRWRADEPRYELEVSAIPLDVPYRLPRVTPRPRIAGLHTAVVTGPPGQEIHTDAAGRVRVRFFWDREGATDDTSSLPVRVAQPNLPGSMLIPRVGWEVAVAFEDGDPDRPVVVGRAYNAKHGPPHSLPANKTVTSLATSSSPGGARKNAVRFDDVAGRQHMAWSAGTGKTTVVANNMMTQTAGNEVCAVGGAQMFSIGASEKVSVKLQYVTDAGSQSLAVGGSQTIRVKGDMGILAGSESVVVGGALLERVGNPVDGVVALAEAAAIHAASAAGAKLGEAMGRWGKTVAAVGALVPHVAGTAAGVAAGAIHGGEEGAKDAAIQAVLGHIPGADAVMAAVYGAGYAPWEPRPDHDGEGGTAPGGGAAGPDAGANGPAGPGPGHRNAKVDGAMVELIGGPHAVMTPAMVRWTTLGRSVFAVGGDHNIQATSVSTSTLGASVDKAASIRISALGGNIVKAVKTALNRTVSGSFTSTAGKDHRIKSGSALSIKVGGAMSLTGGIVTFHCGSSSFSVSSGGVLLKATSVTINGKAQQSGEVDTP